MVDSIAQMYCSTMNGHYGYRYAAWEPEVALRLGDYGTLNKFYFSKIGNISDDFGLTVEEEPSPQVGGTFGYTSKGVRFAQLNASGQGAIDPTTKAAGGFSVTFERENSIFFKSGPTRNIGIKNLKGVEAGIVQRHREGSWDSRYVVISRTISTKRYIVAVSSEAGGTLSVHGDVSTLDDIAQGDARFSCGNRTGIGFEYDHCSLTDTITPIFALMRLRGILEKRLKPYGDAGGGREAETRGPIADHNEASGLFLEDVP